MTTRYILVILFLFILKPVFGQINPDSFNLKAPLNIPLFLSGNFGEIRSSHFHAGIDIKTQSKQGFKVYATEEGYISRIKVSAFGYGNAIYITHPNGLTSVYAHLRYFRNDIAEYVKAEQYRKMQFSINLFPDKEKFKIKRGEMIAYSGNTGGSEGPHLHFELRVTQSEEPINPLLFNFNIKDDLPPELYNIAVFNKNPKKAYDIPEEYLDFDLNGKWKNYQLKGKDTIQVWKNSGFAIYLNDFLNGSFNRCGVNHIRLFLDDELVFESEMEKLNFSETKYIKSYIDYGAKIKTKHSYQKSYKDPNNKISNYKTLVNNGIISISDSLAHKMRYEAEDIYGNTAHVQFYILATLPEYDYSNESKCKYLFPYQSSNSFDTTSLSCHFPSGSLIDTLCFHYQEFPEQDNCFGPSYKIGDIETALLRPFSLEVNIPPSLEDFAPKLVIVKIDSGSVKKPLKALTTSMNENTLLASSSSFGYFSLCMDTLAPEIQSLNISNGKINDQDTLRFIIKDNLSGIESFTAYIDGKWALMQFEAKEDMIYFTFADGLIPPKKEHEIILEVSDRTGNKSIYRSEFYW